MLIKIDLVRIDGGTQQRAEINYDIVDEYVSSINDGAKLPPIEVVFDGSVYWLVDGFHRYHANKKAGFYDIEASVKDGTKRDAFIASLGANHAHGLRRSNADKRKAVLSALNDHELSGIGDTDIARLCYVTRTYVINLKKSLESVNVYTSEEPKTAPEKVVLKQQEQESPIFNDAQATQYHANDEEEDEHTPPPEYTELDQLRDTVSELQDTIEHLTDRCAKLGDEELPLSDMLDELKKENGVLKIQVEMITRSRNQLQTENAELMKQVKYWRKVAGK